MEESETRESNVKLISSNCSTQRTEITRSREQEEGVGEGKSNGSNSGAGTGTRSRHWELKTDGAAGAAWQTACCAKLFLVICLRHSWPCGESFS